MCICLNVNDYNLVSLDRAKDVLGTQESDLNAEH